jgi:uncharacterized protein (UPF0261 family)
MPRPPRILVVGTADTKADELRYLSERVAAAGGVASTMDVGVLGTPPFPPDVRNAEVAAAAGTTLEAIAALGDENAAMARMAEGAVAIVRREHAAGRLDGVLALGGTMGTDLALDVCAALPLGVPKVVVSTVSFSHLLPPERIAPDLTMIGWPGGLYGLNATCRAALSQAAGAVVGACLAVERPAGDRPSVAISSLGTSCLSYVRTLKPALEARGYEVAVFHCTGMGGRAMEALAAEGRFAAVLDLCLQELGNALAGSVVSAGDARLTAAGRRGVPQIVAPGAIDMIDLPSWRPLPEAYAGRPYHAHNRLIGDRDRRRASPRRACDRRAARGGRGTDRVRAAAAGRAAVGPRGRAAARCGRHRGLRRGGARRCAPAGRARRGRRARQRSGVLRGGAGGVRPVGERRPDRRRRL